MIILALGSNLGDRAANLSSAIKELNTIGEVVSVSHAYESDAWGFESTNRFMNIVITFETSLAPLALLDEIQDIERRLGRETKTATAYTDRPIDIDIIDYNGMVLSSERLMLPHPHLHKRNFVLFPLCDVAPEWLHP